MSCCKQKCWMRFLPHNWLCLKGLSVVFTVFFYILLILWLVMWGFIFFSAIPAMRLAGASFTDILLALFGHIFAIVVPVVVMVVFLAFSKILKALHKIVHAVAPCGCHLEEKKEEAK